MKREILHIIRGKYIPCYCKGYDDFAVSDYPVRRRASSRARDKAREHRYVRRILNSKCRKEIYA